MKTDMKTKMYRFLYLIVSRPLLISLPCMAPLLFCCPKEHRADCAAAQCTQSSVGPWALLGPQAPSAATPRMHKATALSPAVQVAQQLHAVDANTGSPCRGNFPIWGYSCPCGDSLSVGTVPDPAQGRAVPKKAGSSQEHIVPSSHAGAA